MTGGGLRSEETASGESRGRRGRDDSSGGHDHGARENAMQSGQAMVRHDGSLRW